MRLRPYDEAEDVDRALPWYRDPETLALSEGPGTPPFDRKRVLRMYQILDRIGELYMIEVREGERWVPVGDVTLARDTLPIVIGERAYRHRGIGSRALGLLVGRARDLGFPSLEAKHIWEWNHASRRLFERCGFRAVATGEEPDGTRYVRYRLTLGSDPGGSGERQESLTPTVSAFRGRGA